MEKAKIQFTLFDKEKKHKPISTIVEVESLEDFSNNKDKYINKAIAKIRKQRGDISLQELKQQGYTQYKTRLYNKAEIDKQAKIAYLQRLYENRQNKKKEKRKE